MDFKGEGVKKLSGTLYDMTARFNNLFELCTYYEDDDSVDDSAFLDELEKILKSVEYELEVKVSNGISLIQSLKSISGGMDGEIKRLQKRKRAVDNRIEIIKQYYLDNLVAMGKTKISTARGTMTVAKAGGKKPLIIDDDSVISNDYKKIIREIDKEKIRRALESGLSVDGAHLEERKHYLKIS